MARQLPIRVGYEYPARPRKHQVPCPHHQGVGHGAFCISGFCTPLARHNTLDFVPKSCAKKVLFPCNGIRKGDVCLSIVRYFSKKIEGWTVPALLTRLFVRFHLLNDLGNLALISFFLPLQIECSDFANPFAFFG